MPWVKIDKIRGNDGASGSNGSNGTNGSAGAAATVSVGAVTNLAAGATPTVVNSGTLSAAVLSFGIPAGAAGANGTNGTNGSTGPSGAVAVTAPITNSGTSTSANIGLVAASASAPGSMSAADFTKLSKLYTRSYIATVSVTKSGAATTETSIIPAGNGSLVVPSAVFDLPAYSFKFECAGTYTNVLTGVVTLRIKIGSLVTLSAAISFPILSARTWRASGIGTVRSGRVVYSSASIEYDNGSSTDGAVFSASNVTVPAGDQTVAFTAAWNLILGGASITVDQLSLDILPSP